MQAVLNLAINALQAMPEGGSLRLGCRPPSRRRVALSVEDTGVGIPPENLPRIFDLYFTTKEKGSGIGLSMVFRIVQLHDGEVEVQSTPGGGTKFTLFFPQAITQEPAPQYGRPIEATRSRARRDRPVDRGRRPAARVHGLPKNPIGSTVRLSAHMNSRVGSLLAAGLLASACATARGDAPWSARRSKCRRCRRASSNRRRRRISGTSNPSPICRRRSPSPPATAKPRPPSTRETNNREPQKAEAKPANPCRSSSRRRPRRRRRRRDGGAANPDARHRRCGRGGAADPRHPAQRPAAA